MSSKSEIVPADYDKGYEENEIGFKGIFGFAIGLVILIVVTFGLMWALLNVLKDNNRDTAGPANPMAMKDIERLPPEPRLQLAPGFGVDAKGGRVNMELGAPQAEYRELKRQWDELWLRGQKDEKTGTVSVMPIEQAKQKLLTQNVKAKSGAEAEQLFKNSKTYITDASSGRVAGERRR